MDVMILLRHAESADSERGQIGAHGTGIGLLSLALNGRRRADRARARRGRRALGRRRALDRGATRTRARGALTDLL